MDHGGEALVGFVVSGGDSPERLEAAEEVLDQMAPSIHVEIARDGLGAVGFRRDDRDRAPLVQLGAQPIDIEGLVAEERGEVDVLDERFDAEAVVTLTGQQDEAGEIAERIDQRDDLGRQATARPSTSSG
jgi:hypothetical protein